MTAAANFVRLFHFVREFFDSKQRNAPDERVRHRLIQRKLDSSPRCFESGQFFLKDDDRRCRRKKAGVIFKTGEMDQMFAVEIEGRNAVADSLDRLRRRLADGLPDFFKDSLRVLGEFFDVFVDRAHVMFNPFTARRQHLALSNFP